MRSIMESPIFREKHVIDAAVTQYRQRLREGLSQDAMIADLHDRGFSILDTIKAVRSVCDVSLGKAKEVVASHAAWHVETRRMVAFADALEVGLAKELARQADNPDASLYDQE